MCFLCSIVFRPQQRGRSAVIEGVYNNVHFMHAIASQIGSVVQIQTKSGAIFEGIFYTVSPHFEIVLQLVHRIEVPGYPVNSSTLTSQTTNTALNACSGNNGKPIKIWYISHTNILTIECDITWIDERKDPFRRMWTTGYNFTFAWFHTLIWCFILLYLSVQWCTDRIFM